MASRADGRSPAATIDAHTRTLAEPAFTMILRGHQTVDAIPAVEATGLVAGSKLVLKNAHGLASGPGAPASARTMEAVLEADPELFENVAALLQRMPFSEVFPVATSAASAANHYRRIFSRNADAPVALLRFRKDPDLIAAP